MQNKNLKVKFYDKQGPDYILIIDVTYCLLCKLCMLIITIHTTIQI